MKQRPDPFETPADNGPLFRTPDPARITRSDGPETSRIAAGDAVASGSVARDRALLVDLVQRFPGQTLAAYGAVAAADDPGRGTPYWWRLKLGRRTGEAVDAGEIYARGRHDAMRLWWPGPDPEREVR